MVDAATRLSELIIEVGAFKDLDRPVILTSGKLGIYYCNTEKLIQDNGEFEKYGENSNGMYRHTLRMMDQHPIFREAIEIISNKVDPYTKVHDFPWISGGQRKDWIFSAPVAHVLGLPHISLYKQPMDSWYEVLSASGDIIPFRYTSDLEDVHAIHIVDLLTEASSCCKVFNGWVPQLRRGGAEITDLFAVTTRLQGGEENLQKIGVNAHPFVEIGPEFLKSYSKNPQSAVEYQKDPDKWIEDYLKTEGALGFIDTFDPKGGKLERVKLFLSNYRSVLVQAGKMEGLEKAVNSRYGLEISNLG